MSHAFSSTTALTVGLATLLLAPSATFAGDPKAPAVAPTPVETGSYSNFARALATEILKGAIPEGAHVVADADAKREGELSFTSKRKKA